MQSAEPEILAAKRDKLPQDSAMSCDSDRRSRCRHPFEAIQRVAPWDGSSIPDAADFVTVMCRDLSSTGISFLLSTRPSFESFVIALGSPPRLTLVAAEVVRLTNVLAYPSGEIEHVLGSTNGSGGDRPGAAPMVLVGARLLDRIDTERDTVSF